MPDTEMPTESGTDKVPKKEEKQKLIEQFLLKKQNLSTDADKIYQMVQSYNEGVRDANEVCFKYSRLLDYGERSRINDLKPYVLSKNAPSKRFKKN